MSDVNVMLRELPICGVSREQLRQLRDKALFIRNVGTYGVLAFVAMMAIGLYNPVERGEFPLLAFFIAMIILCWACYNVLTNIRRGYASYAYMLTECDDTGILNHIAQLSEECSTVKRCIKTIMETSGRQKLFWYEIPVLQDLARKEKLTNSLYQAQSAVRFAAAEGSEREAK
jgi:hypothetical protein